MIPIIVLFVHLIYTFPVLLFWNAISLHLAVDPSKPKPFATPKPIYPAPSQSHSQSPGSLHNSSASSSTSSMSLSSPAPSPRTSFTRNDGAAATSTSPLPLPALPLSSPPSSLSGSVVDTSGGGTAGDRNDLNNNDDAAVMALGNKRVADGPVVRKIAGKKISALFEV